MSAPHVSMCSWAGHVRVAACRWRTFRVHSGIRCPDRTLGALWLECNCVFLGIVDVTDDSLLAWSASGCVDVVCTGAEYMVKRAGVVGQTHLWSGGAPAVTAKLFFEEAVGLVLNQSV